MIPESVMIKGVEMQGRKLNLGKKHCNYSLKYCAKAIL
jgi:hypothetical protein